MKLNIIDSRNHRLDTRLSTLTHPIVSTILPSLGQPLPDEIKAALELDRMSKNNEPVEIDITIEISPWIQKAEAVANLKYTQTLIQRFFLESSHLIPSCQLAIFENGTFTSISNKNTEEQLS